MDDNRNDEIEIDLRKLIFTIYSKLWIIFFIGLIFALLAFIYSKFILIPQYKSVTKIYVLSKQYETNITYSDLKMGSQLTRVYQELIISRPVLDNVISKLNLNEEYEELKNQIEVTITMDTRIISIIVSAQSPVKAMKIANAIREYSAEQIAKVMDIKGINVVEEANLPMNHLVWR